MNTSVSSTSPPGAETDRLTTPAEAAGVRAVMDDSELTVKDLAGTPAKVTAVAPHKFDPVICTTVFPLVGPETGLISMRVGASP